MFRACQVGNAKFNTDQWARLMEYIWDCRAAEILKGTKESIIKEIIESTWDRETNRHRRFDVDKISVNFKTEMGRLIRQIIEIYPSDEQKDAIRQAIRLFNPTNKNESQFVNGKMESADVPTMNVQLVSVGLHAGIRNGNLYRHFQSDQAMALRCTRIAEIHHMAYKGIAGLPAGLPIGQADCAPLPIPANFLMQGGRSDNDRRVIEPVLVRLARMNI